MENFPQSFEPVGSDSILEQFVQLKNFVADKIEEIEEEIVQGDDTKVYFGTEKQEEVFFDSDPQTQITGNKNDITSLTTRIGTDETNIGTNASDISNLKGRMTTAETNIGTNSNDISNLKGRMTSAESGITGLENSVVKFTEQSLTAEQQAQARSNIGAGSSTINVVDNLNSTSAFDALSANQGRVLDGKISTNSSAITGLQTSKQDTIDSSHKLSSDLVDDTSATNKFVTSSDITNWNNKLSNLPIGFVYMSTDSTSPASLFGGTWSSKTSIIIPNSKIYDTIIHAHSSYPTPDYLIVYTNATFPNESSDGVSAYNNWGGGQYAKLLTKGNTIKNFNLGIDLTSDTTTIYVWERIS